MERYTVMVSAPMSFVVDTIAKYRRRPRSAWGRVDLGSRSIVILTLQQPQPLLNREDDICIRC
jgi:hypothetical protein